MTVSLTTVEGVFHRLFLSGVLGTLILFIGIPSWGQTPDYAPDRIVVKLKAETSEAANRAANEMQLLTPIFPNRTTGLQRKQSSRIGLDRMYFVSVPVGTDPMTLARQWQQRAEVEYAEPYYLATPFLVPDDPEAQISGGEQNYLEVIEAYEAWDLTTGDTTMVIAILDSGTDFDHEDMQGQIAYNYFDPINGIDDDGNGYVDDFAGYDFADQDNDASAEIDWHGLRVAGFSSAATNNALGVAGVGYNCRFLPVKHFRSDNNFFSGGYEAIAYAADQGAQVINLSWGSTTSSSQFARDMVDYAVEERDAVVVAAAGNTAAELDFFPASLPNVLSVGASNNQDQKASWATWGPFIDLMAPGDDVYSVETGNTYRRVLGSSYSAPMVAGAAALLRTYRPSLSAMQVMQQLRVSASDIYQVSGNEDYQYRLGSGRLSVIDALVDSALTAVRLVDGAYQGSTGPYAFYDDTLYLTGELVSYLAPWQAGTVTLTTESPFVTLVDSTFSIDQLGTLEGTGQDTLFTVYLHPNLPPETDLLFRLDFAGESYSDFQHWRITSENPFLTLSQGSLEITIGDNGNLGYYEDVKRMGIGLSDGGLSVLNHMGLVVAYNAETIANNAVLEKYTPTRNMDFSGLTPLKRMPSRTLGDELVSLFMKSADESLGLRIQQRWLSPGDTASQDYFVVEYRVANPTDSLQQNLHLGWVADLDGLDEDHEQVAFDSVGNLAYITDSTQNYLVGIAWLSNDSILYRAIDWDTLQGHLSDVGDILSDQDHFDLLTGSNPKLTAGDLPGGNNVGLSAGYFLDSLKVADNHAFAMAILTGNSLSELRQQARDAKVLYEGFSTNVITWQPMEVCANTETVLDPRGGMFEWYTDRELTVRLDSGQSFTMPPISQDTSFYVVNLDSGYRSEVFRLPIHLREPTAAFSLNSDTLLLAPNGGTRAMLSEHSDDAISWAWDFGEGTQSTLQNPLPSYFSPGEYTITLTVTNELGCIDTATQQVHVFARAADPLIQDFRICAGDSPELSAANVSVLAVFPTENTEEPIAEGNSIMLPPLFSDTTVWVSNRDSVFESDRVQVRISITTVSAAMTLAPDTTLLNTLSLSMQDHSEGSDLQTWYVNGINVGETPHIIVPIESSMEVGLRVEESTLGCIDSIGQTVVPTTTTPPDPQRVHVCPEETVTWTSPEGSIWAFAANEAGSSILHKGTTYQNQERETDTVWAASLDGYSLGDFSPLIAQRVSASYRPLTETDTFQVLDTTIFQASDPLAATHLWQVNGGSARTGNPFRQVWLTTGTYYIRLTTLDTLGCMDSVGFNWVVIPRVNPNDTITGLPSLPQASFIVYPNPAEIQATLVWEHEELIPNSIQLLDTQGRVLQTHPWVGLTQQSIELSKLPPGLYAVQLVFQEGIITQLLRKE